MARTLGPQHQRDYDINHSHADRGDCNQDAEQPAKRPNVTTYAFDIGTHRLNFGTHRLNFGTHRLNLGTYLLYIGTNGVNIGFCSQMLVCPFQPGNAFAQWRA